MTKYQSVLNRFVWAFISGFLSGASMVTLADVHIWGQLNTALQALLLSGVVGGINGVLLAGKKYLTWTDESPTPQI